MRLKKIIYVPYLKRDFTIHFVIFIKNNFPAFEGQTHINIIICNYILFHPMLIFIK